MREILDLWLIHSLSGGVRARRLKSGSVEAREQRGRFGAVDERSASRSIWTGPEGDELSAIDSSSKPDYMFRSTNIVLDIASTCMYRCKSSKVREEC